MDVDLLNTPTDAQMELMSMMIQMEKLTEFSEPPPSLAFSNNPTRSFYNPATHDPLLDPILSHPTEMSLSIDPSNERRASVAAMREMIFRMAAMQPIHIDPESVKPPKRRNVRISKDPQSVAARHRRERISERIRILQRLVPGGTKMDTASMLDEAIHYVKFLKSQVQSLERVAASRGAGFSPAAGTFSGGNYMCFGGVDQGFISSGQMMS